MICFEIDSSGVIQVTGISESHVTLSLTATYPGHFMSSIQTDTLYPSFRCWQGTLWLLKKCYTLGVGYKVAIDLHRVKSEFLYLFYYDLSHTVNKIFIPECGVQMYKYDYF